MRCRGGGSWRESDPEGKCRGAEDEVPRRGVTFGGGAAARGMCPGGGVTAGG